MRAGTSADVGAMTLLYEGTVIGADGARGAPGSVPTSAAACRSHFVLVVGSDVAALPTGVFVQTTTPTTAVADDIWVHMTTKVVKKYVGTDEVQTITVNATGGVFTITFSGQTTTGLAWNASAGTVQTALEALSNIAGGGVDVVVTGGPGASAAFTVSFQNGGAYGNTNVAAMTTGVGSLTGGASTAVVATTVPGVDWVTLS